MKTHDNGVVLFASVNEVCLATKLGKLADGTVYVAHEFKNDNELYDEWYVQIAGQGHLCTCESEAMALSIAAMFAAMVKIPPDQDCDTCDNAPTLDGDWNDHDDARCRRCLAGGKMLEYQRKPEPNAVQGKGRMKR